MKTIFLLFFVSILTSCDLLFSESSREQPKVENIEPITVSQTQVYECDDYSFSVETNNPDSGEVTLYLPERTITLNQVRAASGVKYQNSEVLFWHKGDTALLEIAGKTFNNCQRDPQRESRDTQDKRPVDFRATGNEPGWFLEIVDEHSIRILTDYGNNRIVTPATAPQLSEAEKTYDVETETHKIHLIIQQKSCTDTMSGDKFESEITPFG